MIPMYKLLLSWDIQPGRNQEYSEFMMREFVPRINKMGLTPSEAWLAVYGDCPQIMMEAVAEEVATIRDFLASPEWATLHEKLLELVENYSQKTVRAGRGFQI